MTTSVASDAHQLADFIFSLDGFVVVSRDRPCYSHMGATICDSILQAGLNYRTVVEPRVRNIIQQWPSAWRTSSFYGNVKRYGVCNVLAWRHPEKPRRIRELTELFIDQQIETEDCLRTWLKDETNVDSLQSIRGVGPKTADYIKTLVGLPAIAIDRHIRSFTTWAGLQISKYDRIKETVCMAADILGYEHQALDHAIWLYVSTSPFLRNQPEKRNAA